MEVFDLALQFVPNVKADIQTALAVLVFLGFIFWGYSLLRTLFDKNSSYLKNKESAEEKKGLFSDFFENDEEGNV